MSELRLSLADVRRRRPPKVEVRLDLDVVSDAPAACWAILPDTLAAPPPEPGGSVWSLTARRLGDAGSIVLARATGDAGWFALHVPARTTIGLRSLVLSWWGELPDRLDVAGLLVSDIAVDGVSLGSKLALEHPDGPRLSAAADCDATVLAHFAGSPQQPLAVSWVPVGHLRASVALPAASAAPSPGDGA